MDSRELYCNIKIQKRSKLRNSWRFLAEHCSAYMLRNECYQVKYSLSEILELGNIISKLFNESSLINGMEAWGYDVEIEIPKEVSFFEYQPNPTIIIISIPKSIIDEYEEKNS